MSAAGSRADILARRTVVASGPSTVNVELTGRCNVKPPCLFCTGKNARGYKDPGDVSPAQLEPYWPFLLGTRQVNDCSFGEPLTHPRFDAFAERVIAAGVRFGFTTNGWLLGESRCRFLAERADLISLVISVNAARPATYRWLQGLDLRLLLRNVEALVRLCQRARPGRAAPVALSFVVTRSTRDEVLEFLHLARELGVSHVHLRHLFDTQAGDYVRARMGRAFAYERERLSMAEYRRIEEQVRAEPGLGDLTVQVIWNARDGFMAEQAEEGLPCAFPWKFLAIRPLHDEYSPCAFLKTSIAAPSRISLESVWNGDTYVEMRRSLAEGRLPRLCLASGVCPLVVAERARA